MFPAHGTSETATTLFAFFSPGWVEMSVLALVVLLLFGNRLPSVMRSLGQGITEFKKGIKSGDSEASGNLEDRRDS